MTLEGLLVGTPSSLSPAQLLEHAEEIIGSYASAAQFGLDHWERVGHLREPSPDTEAAAAYFAELFDTDWLVTLVLVGLVEKVNAVAALPGNAPDFGPRWKDAGELWLRSSIKIESLREWVHEWPLKPAGA